MLALKDRILKSTSVSPPPSIVGGYQSRPLKYKGWTESKLYTAFEAVQSGGMSIRRAAEAYNVPRSTLQDRISGRVQFGAKSGPAKYLTDEEEEELVTFVTGCAAMGYAKSKQEIINIVRNVITEKGSDGIVTDGWWSSFKRRHGQLTLRTAEPVSYARSVSTSPEVISQYYDILEKTLLENDLIDKPCQVYNMDEMGVPLDPNPPKVIALKGTKHPTCLTTGNKAQITVVGCCSAGGRALPPMIVFDQKTLKPEWTIGEFPGTKYALSKNGWMDSELFDLWFNQVFLPHAEPLRPLILVLDGHSTHYQPSVIRKAAEEQVIIFCLPPHTTHRTQPLDKGCFGPLKMAWRNKCKEFITKNPGRVVTRHEFSRLFCKSWEKSMSMTNIMAGFRVTGIYPFNRNALSSSEPPKSASVPGLKYIPILTPSRSDGATGFTNFSVTETSFFEARYAKWLEKNHPEVCKNSSGTENEEDISQFEEPIVRQQLSFEDEIEASHISHQTVFSKTLSAMPPQTVKYPILKGNDNDRVLTSAENLKRLDQKEMEKKAKEIEKQLKIEKREQRRKELLQKKLDRQKKLQLKKKPSRRTVESSLSGESTLHKDELEFTEEECQLFHTRLEEGYDLPPTGRYALWLQKRRDN